MFNIPLAIELSVIFINVIIVKILDLRNKTLLEKKTCGNTTVLCDIFYKKDISKIG
jgi:hypothetical protein